MFSGVGLRAYVLYLCECQWTVTPVGWGMSCLVPLYLGLWKREGGVLADN